MRSLAAGFHACHHFVLENLALRHQLLGLNRTIKTPAPRKTDRLFWATLSAMWSRWTKALVIVQPQTTVRWHQAGFLELFGTRRSVFPQRWENAKTGRNGYSPVCDNEWRAGFCRKPQEKSTECPHQRFPSLDQRAVESHLRGERTLGVYAIGEDDTCRFLAADFDGEGWRDDVLAYREAAERVGITVAPTEEWMKQIARNLTMVGDGFLNGCRHLLHDRDTKFSVAFCAILRSAGVEPVALPPRSPNLNAHLERWNRSVKEECLSKLILFGEASLRHVLLNYARHYHEERNHQGKDNVILFPVAAHRLGSSSGKIRTRERLGGLLKFYHREAA